MERTSPFSLVFPDKPVLVDSPYETVCDVCMCGMCFLLRLVLQWSLRITYASKLQHYAVKEYVVDLDINQDMEFVSYK